MTSLMTTTSGASATRLLVRAADDQRLLDLWLHGKSNATTTAYRGDVRDLLARGPLAELTLDRLQRWVDSLLNYTRASRARKISAAKSLLRFAHWTGYILFTVGVAVKPPFRAKKEPGE